MGIGSAIGGGVGGFLGGIAGELWAGMDEKEIDRLLQESQDEYGNIDLPKLEGLVKGTAYENVTEDPAMRGAQTSAINSLRRRADEGGLAIEDRASLAESMNEVGAQDAGRRNAIKSSFDRRGAGGSGTAYAAQLQNSADATEQSANNALQIHGDASRRAIQSLRESSGIAGDVRGQDYRAQSDKAQARDRVSEFNSGLQERFGQNNFRNKMGLADAKNDIRKEKIGNERDDQERKRRLANGIGQGVGSVAGAVIGG